MKMKMKFAINVHTQILNTAYSQYKRISNSVLIIQDVRFCGKRNYSNFTKVRLRFLALPDFLRGSGSGTGSTQPREYS
jgi:hypothetical protein